MKRVLMATAKTHQIGNSPPRAGMHGPPTLQEVGLYKHQEGSRLSPSNPTCAGTCICYHYVLETQ